MVETASTMLPLGTALPSFSLPNVVDGRTVTEDGFADANALLVMFICNHCPFVKHVLDELGRLDRDYQAQDLAVVAISSNDPEAYPEDAPERMKEVATAQGWRFPYLFDETQETAKRFRAACTPDFYLFDGDRRLVYRGQLDDSRPQKRDPGDRARSPRRDRRGPRGRRDADRTTTEPGMQYQVEAGERAAVFWDYMTLTLKSTAFADGQEIPREYTCDGADVSPPLAWSGTPKEPRATC